MKLQRFFLFILICATFLPVCFGQIGTRQESVDGVKYFDENKRWYNEFTEHWFFFGGISEDDVRDSIIQWEEIGKDLADSKNIWAGTYGDGGETHGDYLRWSEKTGFVWLKINKCQGGPMQIIRGKVVAGSSQIQLIPEHILGDIISHTDHEGKNQETELLFVKWHGVSFLIKKEALENFADYTAGLGQYNGVAMFFLGNPFMSKLGSETEGKNFELPIFPKGYEKFVKHPVKAQIISVGKSFRQKDADDPDWESLITPIRLNAGKSGGAIRDLQLFYTNQEQHPTEKIVIKEVKNIYSTAQVIRLVRKKNCVITESNDCENFDYTKLKAGLRLSTTGN